MGNNGVEVQQNLRTSQLMELDLSAIIRLKHICKKRWQLLFKVYVLYTQERMLETLPCLQDHLQEESSTTGAWNFGYSYSS